MESSVIDPDKIYHSEDLLTLQTDEGEKTMSIGAWINTDPARIHRMATREKAIQLDYIEVFLPLMSKLRRYDLAYYKKVMGLKIKIDFPGFPPDTEAKIPFDTDPVAFYKWWRKNKHEDVVYLSKGNQFILFQKVMKIDEKIMLKKDKDFVLNF